MTVPRSRFLRRSRSVRFTLIISFVFLIVLAVGITGFLLIRNAQQSVSELAVRLQSEITGRISQNLDSYLSTPFQINQINQSAIRQGLLDFAHKDAALHYFWQMGQTYPNFGTIAYADAQGEFYGANKPENYIVLADQPTTQGAIRRYEPSSDGYPSSKIILDQPNYDPRTRSWYQTAAAAGKPTWTDINVSATAARLDASAVAPYLVDGQLQGVNLVDVPLSQLSEFLQSLNVGPGGEVFVIDRLGQIVASSSTEKPFVMVDEAKQEVKRLPATASTDPLIASASQYLTKQYLDLNQITANTALRFESPNGPVYLQVTPYQQPGLDWLIGVATPESNVMGSINAGTSATVVLALIAVIGVIAASVYLANRITRPISQLSTSAKKLAAGEWEQTAIADRDDELGELADSYNTMATQLRAKIAGLEQRIEARTEQLRASADVGRTAASVLDPDELLRSVVNLIAERFGFYYAAVFTCDNQNRYAVLREATGEAGRSLKERHHQLEIGGQSMVGYVIARRRLRIALDVGAEAVRFANPLLPDTRSEIALPLIVGDQVLGALDVQSTQEAAFDESNAAVLQSMADQVAIALSNALQFKESRAEAQLAATLAESITALVGANTMQGTIEILAQSANRLLNAHRTAVYLVDIEQQRVLGQAVGGDTYDVEKLSFDTLNSGISGMVFSSGKPVLSLSADDGIEPAETRERRRQFGTGALIVAPLVAQGRVIGTLTVSNRIGERLFTQRDVDLLMTLAAQSVSMIEKQRLFEQVQTTLRDLDEANRQLTGAGWKKYTGRHTQNELIWISRSDQLQPQTQQEVSEALARGHVATRLIDNSRIPQLSVAVPIKLRDVPIGTLRLIVPLHAWTNELAAALESIASHVAQAAENARLIAESEERLARERALTEATEKVRQRNEIDAILETAAGELARYLNANRIGVRLTPQATAANDRGQA